MGSFRSASSSHGSLRAPLQIEYNLVKSYRDHLEVLDIHKTDQENYPTCMIWYPPLTKERFLLISTSGYKVKLFNATTKMCRCARGLPTHRAPVRFSAPAGSQPQPRDLPAALVAQRRRRSPCHSGGRRRLGSASGGDQGPAQHRPELRPLSSVPETQRRDQTFLEALYNPLLFPRGGTQIFPLEYYQPFDFSYSWF